MCVFMCEMEKENNNRCGKCNSLQTYLRLKTGERVCRSCGHIGNLDEE